MKINYTTWLKTELGISSEVIELSKATNTVAQIIDLLEGRGSKYQSVFKRRNVIYAEAGGGLLKNHQVLSSDVSEITFFSPIVGG